MKRHKSFGLLLGLVFEIYVAGQSLQSRAQITSTAESVHGSRQEPDSSRTAQNKPLITIHGLCDQPVDAKPESSTCQTVITRDQFEKLIAAVQPNMPLRGRQEFAERYADALVLAKKAEQMGLDRGATFEEQMEVARIQILSQDLKKVIQEKAVQISDHDVEDFYHSNAARFERETVDRIFIPRKQQLSPVSDNKMSAKDPQSPSSGSEQTMKKEADSLRARAIAGEDFTKLQADAYQVAGIKSNTPATTLEIRRVSLPQNQASVMDLKPGEISPVLDDPNGYFVYKVKTKDSLPLEQAREEIKAILRSQRMKDEMLKVQNSTTLALDESYFAK